MEELPKIPKIEVEVEEADTLEKPRVSRQNNNFMKIMTDRELQEIDSDRFEKLKQEVFAAHKESGQWVYEDSMKAPDPRFKDAEDVVAGFYEELEKYTQSSKIKD